MSGEMCWLNQTSPEGERVLHLRSHPTQPWQPYNTYPVAVADHNIPEGSKGWATYQKLLRAGWTLLPSA